MSKETVFCPNCQKPAIKEGDMITCENCDAVFKITKAEAKVKSAGTLEELNKRITVLERLNQAKLPAEGILYDDPGNSEGIY